MPFVFKIKIMDEIFIVYKTDNWHSYESRDVIGIATDRSYAMLLCNEKAAKEGCQIAGDQSWNLANLQQTQGYMGEGEFQYEKLFTNVLL
jgi:hypothetical protein